MPDSNSNKTRIWEHEDTRHHWVSLYHIGRVIQWLGLAVAGAAAFLFLPVVDAATAFCWLGAYTGITLVLLYYTRRFLRRQASIRDFGPWRRGYIGGLALIGLMWGMTILVYRNDWPGPYQVYMFLIYAGLVSAATSAYAASLASFAAFTTAVLGPVFLKLGLSEFPGSSKFALLVLLYGCVMYLIARSFHERVRSVAGLQLTHSELLDHLEEVNEDLDLEVEHRSVVEQRLWRERKLFLDGPVVVFRWKNQPGWPIEYVSPNVRQFGLDAGELRTANVPYARYIHPQDLALVDKAAPVDDLDVKHPALRKDYRLKLPDGDVRWVYDHTIPVFDARHRVTHYDGYILDITGRKSAEQSMLAEKERVEVTLHSIGDGVITTDQHNVITYMNPAAEALTGVKLDNARGLILSAVFRVDDEQGARAQEILDAYGASNQQSQRSARLASFAGRTHDIIYGLAPIKDHEANRIGLVVVFHDASESVAMSRELEYHASHDSLTGTLNRRAFEARLESALTTVRAEGVKHALIYIDLDQFKVINDSYGHRAGDRFLRQVSDGLARIIDAADELARLGGDEFAVLLYRCSANRARGIAMQIKNYIQSIRYQWENRVFTVSASIGISEINSASESVEQVLSAADMACYAAKDAGRNRIRIYRDSDREIRKRHSDMKWIARIQSALEEDRLLLFTQKIEPVSLPGEPVTRQEILVRLLDDAGKLVPASTFLSAVERYNLGPAVDRWVIRESLKSIREIAQPGKVFFINVSGTSLSQQDFLRFIKARFEEYGVAGKQICFEITETAAISNLQHAVKFVTELKSMGCHFALDDFGSGLSSFAYLKELSVDYLKIDGSFIQNIVEDTLDHALVEAINQVGHVLLIDTVAEHVENAFVFEAIKRIGIDYAQGNYIHHVEPLPGQARKLNELAATFG